MSSVTPRRSTRIPHTHTPKMGDRKKGLFQAGIESMTQHRRLPVVESESDPEDCDLGIISTLDSSSGDEQQDQMAPKTPERSIWPHRTRSHTRRLLKESSDLKNFIKSPFTLNKYQTMHTETKNQHSSSTPSTPNLHYDPTTPSSSHSCGSVHTTSSTNSRARKSLASLIADTESCSSSLKDLNFDSDDTDSKENTPTKPLRKSSRKIKLTPKLATFRGILSEQKKNSPSKSSPKTLPLVCLTKMDIGDLSPTQMLKTPNTTTEPKCGSSPPKINHRKPVLEIEESPEFKCDSEISHKRLRNDSISDSAPNNKYPKLDSFTAPKARLSLFNSCDKLKEISAKSFYGKRELDSTNVIKNVDKGLFKAKEDMRRLVPTSSRRRSRKPGQINLGVKHKIKKPKLHKGKIVNLNRGSVKPLGERSANHSMTSDKSLNNSSMLNSSQDIETEKVDPFDSEKQTIEALLNQWEEEDLPESELIATRVELPCFNSQVIAETSTIFQPAAAAVPVVAEGVAPLSEHIVEIGATKPLKDEPVPQSSTDDVVMLSPARHSDSHGSQPAEHFLPVEGGFILVDDQPLGDDDEEELTDLDAIEKELAALDEQILRMARTNNIDAGAVLASTETGACTNVANKQNTKSDKLFPIFSNPKAGSTSTNVKESTESVPKKSILKSMSDQYVIDAGQKRFGATQCKECGVIYEIGDPQDEHDHLVHHNATDVLRFNGWKEERVSCSWEDGRCVQVRGSDPQWRKVDALLARVIHPHLGYGASLPSTNIYTYTAFLFVDKKQIVGCVIVEPKARAFKLLPGDPDCCSVEDYPVKCGISRIWVHRSRRRTGVARRLLDCARARVMLGQALLPQDLAFSAPTAQGKALATSYCGTQNFYVYLD